MAWRDLLLRSGTGAGVLKDLEQDYKLHANIIKIMKEISDIDHDIELAKNTRNYTKMYSLVARQLGLVEQVSHFSIVKTMRLQQSYKEILAALNQYDKHYQEKRKLSNSEEKKISRIEDPTAKSQAKQKLAQVRSELDTFSSHIKKIRQAVSELRKHVRNQSKRKIIKMKQIKHFA